MLHGLLKKSTMLDIAMLSAQQFAWRGVDVDVCGQSLRNVIRLYCHSWSKARRKACTLRDLPLLSLARVHERWGEKDQEKTKRRCVFCGSGLIRGKNFFELPAMLHMPGGLQGPGSRRCHIYQG
jgi:hypothetical protein